mmetsp:Transcript_15093/g.43280  ORF Transcript_15093/g.43280 Transcript_15093/m.43280 type:complete len:261 (+) Transcript_15093:77-859(+)
MASSGASAASSAPTRGQRAPTFRTTFDSPWRIQWSVLDAKKTEQISRALQSTVRDVKQRDKSAKSVFLVGINHVTRALERGACAAVIVGRDSEYTALVQHLPVQAALADVPCVILPKSLPLREAFLLPRVLAVGLRSPSHNEAAAPSPSPSPPRQPGFPQQAGRGDDGPSAVHSLNELVIIQPSHGWRCCRAGWRDHVAIEHADARDRRGHHGHGHGNGNGHGNAWRSAVVPPAPAATTAASARAQLAIDFPERWWWWCG